MGRIGSYRERRFRNGSSACVEATGRRFRESSGTRTPRGGTAAKRDSHRLMQSGAPRSKPNPRLGTVARGVHYVIVRQAPHHLSRSDPVIPSHTIAFNQQKLRSALRRAAQQDAALTYGFVIHARRRGTRAALGVITLGGESLVLTSGLIAGLAGLPLRLFGSAPISLQQGSAAGGLERDPTRPDIPLASVMMQVEGVNNPAAARQRVEVEAKVIADSLVQPLVVLTSTRPASWPR